MDLAEPTGNSVTECIGSVQPRRGSQLIVRSDELQIVFLTRGNLGLHSALAVSLRNKTVLRGQNIDSEPVFKDRLLQEVRHGKERLSTSGAFEHSDIASTSHD